MSRSLVGSSHLGQKGSHGDALLWLKKRRKKRKIGGHDGKLLEKLRKKRGNTMEIAANFEKKKDQQTVTQYNQGTQPNWEDQLSKIHGMTTCVLSLCERVRRKPEL